jgi:hypothetical protein
MQSVIKGSEFKEFEKKILKEEKNDFRKNLRIMESLYKEAVALGVFSLKDPLDGLEVDIKIARVINSVSKIT